MRDRRPSRTAAWLAVVALCCVGCSGHSPPDETPRQTSATTPSPTTPGDLVVALDRQGLQTINPVDATSAECPAAGCAQAVVTDRFRVLMFETTGAAQTYASSRNLRQVETFVVAFAPVVEPDEADRYWSAIVGLVR